jgi:hypothetical protein
MQDLHTRGPIRVLVGHLGGGLAPGQVGFIVAQPGVGKSAFLAHLGLDQVLHGSNVLHIALGETVERVRATYDQLFRAASHKSKARARESAVVQSERHRMIHSYMERTFDVSQLRENIRVLRDLAHFECRIVLVDGVAADNLAKAAADFHDLARDLDIPLWFTARSTDVIDEEVWNHAAFGLQLSPHGTYVTVNRLHANGGVEELSLNLDPNSLLVMEEEVWDPTSAPISPNPSECSLYSGGVKGAEQCFGDCAQAWGLNEMNFTFEGHQQANSRGRYLLSPRELQAGDVSLLYVSKRLKRTYSEGSLIRKVLQTLWHMVSRSQQIFVVGAIQEDGTVIGGTGWSVELAKMWNKSLWVFDQEKNAWFTWDGEEWLSGVPVIEALHFTGTGTRFLEENGQKAIQSLFERSFSREGS